MALLLVGQVVLLLDGDDAGRAATDDCLVRLGRRVAVKAIPLAEDQQPDMRSAAVAGVRRGVLGAFAGLLTAFQAVSGRTPACHRRLEVCQSANPRG